MINAPHRRRDARHQQIGGMPQHIITRRGSARHKNPITVEMVTQTALATIAKDGYDALTMRSLAAALDTGPASLYSHVVNKADLDELLIGYLCNQIDLPQPHPDRWRQQMMTVCADIRDQYIQYPGLSRAALAVAPVNVDVFRMSEGMLSILLAGGIEPRSAAWVLDALVLYINAYCLELSLVERRPGQDDAGWVASRQELLDRFASLPDNFPNTKRYARELTSGSGHDRFDFTVRLIINSLQPHKGTAR